nr:sialate O-acetylesterase [Polyangiaceae bacterium]
LDRALERLTQRGLTYQMAGVLWMQGENEAGRKLQIAQEYQQRLTALIAAMRQDLKTPALPFVIGRVSDNLYARNGGPIDPERDSSIDTVRAAQKAVDDADPAVALIDTDDFLPREDDPYHFDSNAYLTMGERFALTMGERFASAFLTLAPGGGGGQSGAAGQSGEAGGAGAGSGGTAGAVGGPAGTGGTGIAGASAGVSGSPTNPGGGDDDDDGCTIGTSRATPLVALFSLALAALGLLRRSRSPD